MFNIVDYEEIMNDENLIFVDVRSPKEFEEATIKGAINIPVLLDSEREEVGTLYVRNSVEEARTKGIEFISKRLPEIFEKFQNLYSIERKRVVIFCARGGMRSSSIHSLLYSLGLKVYKLKGGYKGYRRYINDHFNEVIKDVNFIVLYGKTGVGKTEYLKELDRRGIDILDLEGAANHRGSLLGSVSIGECNTQKTFETEVFHALQKRKSNLVFTEGESKRIGRIIIPDNIWGKIMNSNKVWIEDSIENRCDLLTKEYIQDENSVNELLEAMDKIKKYLSVKKVEAYKDMIKSGNYKEACINLMENYYDPMYLNGFKEKTFIESIENSDRDKTLEKLIEIYKKLEPIYNPKEDIEEDIEEGK
ncbi:MAG: tRNA 2-selenouridine(34) synthase MnmH [Clostridium sp.]